MFALLRRYQPKPVALAVLYWTSSRCSRWRSCSWFFYLIDGFLPGGGMF